LLPPVKSYRAERKENVLWTFLANEPAGVDGCMVRKVMLEMTLITEMTYLFSVRLASFRWQELYLGLFTELGKLHTNVKGNVQ